jgi:hypothetical protein
MMLTQEETNRIKSYHAVITSAKESIAGIIADSWERTRLERIEKARLVRDMQTKTIIDWCEKRGLNYSIESKNNYLL